MDSHSLHDRLEALGQKIAAAEAKLRDRAPHGAAQLTAQELKTSYQRLQARLNREIADTEAQGHHVTDLERSVRQWIDSLDAFHTATE
ncbi:3-ketoacyl-ACP reductase [Seohaeicola nanhaiensis]|uniref:3-ketoacyl-ACP reductase n=1 Tax=Seohaeicola nanhaiensis TaxID=1387282 RepID=A0ABV9KJS5_9RHOB